MTGGLFDHPAADPLAGPVQLALGNDAGPYRRPDGTTQLSLAALAGPDAWHGITAGRTVATYPDRWTAERALAARTVESIAPAHQPGPGAHPTVPQDRRNDPAPTTTTPDTADSPTAPQTKE